MPCQVEGLSLCGVGVETITLPLDRGGFCRRRCPDCQREFKVRWTEMEGRLILQHLGASIRFANLDEVARAHPLVCPYCAHRESADSFFTPAQREHLARRAESLEAEIRFEQLRHVERSLAENPYPTFLALPPAPFRASLGPEPDDMRVILLPCCEEEIKIRESWTGWIRCPYCASHVEI